jgi:hypothetical protein
MNGEPKGCGISRIWQTSKKDPFKPACDLHDDFYEEGSDAQKVLTRKEADEIFLKHMMHIASGSVYLYAKAHIYYFLVRALAWQWWEGK